MCRNAGCASYESKTLLQEKSTLLLPVQSQDAVVVGYYVDSTSDSSSDLYMGKYVYCSQSRELIKVSKVQGPPSSTSWLSICINRTNVVGNGMFIKDYIMISFPWQSSSTSVPSQCVVHSRTLSFHKLSQTAQQAGLTGHYQDTEYVSAAVNSSADLGVSEHSFYGLGAFGVYECVLVPSKLSAGMSAERNEPPSLSFGAWAVPEHCAFCRGHQVLHMGVFANETAWLRSQFLHMYSQSNSIARPLPTNDPSVSFDENSQTERDDATSRGAQSRGVVDVISAQRENVCNYSPRQTVYRAKGVSSDFEYSKEVPATDPTVTVSTSSTGRFPTNRHVRDAHTIEETENRREITTDTVGTTSNLPPDISTSVMLPIQCQMSAVARQEFHTRVEEALEAVPGSIVDSIDAVVTGQRTSTEDVKRSGTNTPGSYSSPVASLPTTPRTSSDSRPGTKRPDSSYTPHTFKKTLPAPTKSEIVIRNRISAQRSNEKRRRKIEVTKSELAYLKSTYLPQLELKQGSLVSENQSLRLKFMEQYHESDIDSFF